MSNRTPQSTRQPSTSLDDDRNELKKRLALVITKLNASVTPRPSDNDEAMTIIDELCSINPTVTGTASSPLLEGSWILLWTGAYNKQATGLGKNRKGLSSGGALSNGLASFPLIQEASDAAYSFFYKSFPLLAGSAVGVKGSTSAMKAKGNVQYFDLKKQTVVNEAKFVALGQDCSIRVGGVFCPVGPDSPNKIRATFTSGRVKVGLISLDIPIGVISPVGFVDTPYLDEEFRISIGDKGSIFIARKTQDL